MSTANAQVVRWGAEQARIGPWQGDDRVAFLSPLAGTPPPSVTFVRRCLDQLAGRGFSRVVTGALAAPEQIAFLGAGFEVEESLHVLSADLSDLASGWKRHTPSGLLIRRVHSADRPNVLALDHLAFDAFWQLDETGLALAGKWAASLFSAAAAALLYLAVGRRRPHRDALWTAVAFALGTTVWSTSQARSRSTLSRHCSGIPMRDDHVAGRRSANF